MNRRNILKLAALSGLGLPFASALAQQGSLKDQLVGSWTLVSADAFGANPRGSLMFEPSGHFAAVLMRTSLPKIAADSRLKGTPEEYNTIVGGTLTFFGTYAVSGTDLNLRIEGSSFPNWDDTNQKRTNLSISGDELKYTQPAPSGGGGATVVVWKRAKVQ